MPRRDRMPATRSFVTFELYRERAASIRLFAAFTGLDSPVFLTRDWPGSGATTILFVNAGRLTGALEGVEEESEVVRSAVAGGWLVGWLDTVLTTLCRS